jgi:hypothetical protein
MPRATLSVLLLVACTACAPEPGQPVAPGRESPELDRRERRALRRHGIMHMSCWDYRITWLEADGSAAETAWSTLIGTTPHVAIAPAEAGTLVLEVDWPAKCEECRLLISEHNSGMAQLITPTSTRTEAERNGAPIVRERLEFAVTPGDYHMVGQASTDTDYTMRAELRDGDGKPGRVTRHGVVWQRECEG